MSLDQSSHNNNTAMPLFLCVPMIWSMGRLLLWVSSSANLPLMIVMAATAMGPKALPLPPPTKVEVKENLNSHGQSRECPDSKYSLRQILDKIFPKCKLDIYI